VGYAAEETGRRDRDLGYAASMPEMHARLLAEQNRGGELEVGDRGPRLVFERASAPYPSTQRYLAVARLDLPRQVDLFAATADA
jgi:hypothetical protein